MRTEVVIGIGFVDDKENKEKDEIFPTIDL